jgi:hypothetical protein
MSSYAAAATGPLQAIGGMNQANTDANISEYNAEVASQNAATDTALGKEAARRSLVNSTKMIGTQAAGYAASGLAPQGSAQWVMSNSASQGELNALTVQHGYDMKANALNNEASLDRFKAQNQRVAGYMNAATAFLGAGSEFQKSAGGSGGSGDNTTGSQEDGGASADNTGAEGDYSEVGGEEAVV